MAISRPNVGCFVFLACVVLTTQAASHHEREKTLDEVIMEANSQKSMDMLDPFLMMDGDKMMMMIELDILMNLTEVRKYRSGGSRVKRKALRFEGSRWPDCSVPYEINSPDFNGREQEIIKAAIRDWESYTCLKFIRVSASSRDSFPNRILFRNADGCYSRLGHVGGVQSIGLGRGCRQKGIVVHEIGHAIGWIHEQARPDRDEYIFVNYAQIPRNWHPQFDKFDKGLINPMRVEYDYTSIMHYSGRSFGEGTIQTKDPAFQNKIGQRQGMSFRDIKIANLMYSCAERMQCPNRPCPGEGFMDKNCQCMCPGSDLTNPLVPCSSVRTTTTTTTTATTTTTPAITTAPTAPKECSDILPAQTCRQYAQTGQCVTDKARMIQFCRSTCDLCDQDVDEMCMDYNEACPIFARLGYCTETGISNYVSANCPRSCKLCQAVPCSQQDARFVSPNTGSEMSAGSFSLLLSAVLTILYSF